MMALLGLGDAPALGAAGGSVDGGGGMDGGED